MILLDLDPNVVKPGWIPLLITIGLGLVMVLLFRSMRRQFRRVDANFPPPEPRATPSATPAEERTDASTTDADRGTPDAPPAATAEDAAGSTRQGRPIPR